MVQELQLAMLRRAAMRKSRCVMAIGPQRVAPGRETDGALLSWGLS